MDSLWQYPIDRIQFTLNNWNRSVWQWWPKKGKIIHSYKIIRAVRVENCVRIWNIISVIAFSTTQAHARREHNNNRLTYWVRLKECSRSLSLPCVQARNFALFSSIAFARTYAYIRSEWFTRSLTDYFTFTCINFNDSHVKFTHAHQYMR